MGLNFMLALEPFQARQSRLKVRNVGDLGTAPWNLLHEPNVSRLGSGSNPVRIYVKRMNVASNPIPSYQARPSFAGGWESLDLTRLGF
jgi:hypothetical protein